MNAPADNSVTLWSRGALREGSGSGGLLFGRMYEDADIERSLFPPAGRYLCIASAGCTALELSHPASHIVAVDVNPHQIEYLRRRIAGGGVEQGRVDRMLAVARRGYRLAGVNVDDLKQFLMMENPEKQVLYWRQRLCTRRSRLALAMILGPLSLAFLYAPRYRQTIPTAFSRTILSRLERGFGRHANRNNRHAWQLLLGVDPPGAEPVVARGPIEPVCDDILALLRRTPDRSFDGFSLSNILDGAGDRFARELRGEIERTSAAGAVVVLRSIREAGEEKVRELAARDRSMLWGGVEVGGPPHPRPLSQSPSAGEGSGVSQ